MRFTIRDLIWLMVVASMACGWWVERSRLADRAQNAEWTVAMLKNMKDEAEHQRDELGAVLDSVEPTWRTTRGPFNYFKFYDVPDSPDSN